MRHRTLVHFRKRIGEVGIEKIFKASIKLHGDKANESHIVIDTTVQEKNITFPTDTKLRVKVIAKCWKLAAEEGIQLRRSYRREFKKLLLIIRFNKTKADKQKVSAAIRRVKTMANALLRDVKRKLSKTGMTKHAEQLDIFYRALNQQRQDKNKIYSLHEPKVSCICKGKEHKKYEFSAKAAIVMTKTSCLVVGAKSFSRTEYDGATLDSVLKQVTELRGIAQETAFCDRGFRGRKCVENTNISLPDSPHTDATEHHKRKARKNFGRRSAIEPVIGHLKSDFRLARNFLKGTIGDAINLLMAAAAFNCRKWMRALVATLFFALACIWKGRDEKLVPLLQLQKFAF